MGQVRSPPALGPGSRALLPFSASPSPRGIAGTGSLSHPEAGSSVASRSCSPTLGYLRWNKTVGGFSWICSVVSDFHPFICFPAGSGDWNPSGVATHQQQENAPLSRRIFFVPKAFSRVRYGFSIFPCSLQEGTGLGLPCFSAVRCQLPEDGE